jgi:hypothetical protein
MQVKPLSPSATDEQSTRKYRVVQWATGTIGARALRAVIEHPHMSLAGVYVHGQDKVGRDAGELCGTASTGVTATDRIDDIVELQPDCVLYMPNALNLGELCRLLAAGINVVTTCGAFHHPLGQHLARASAPTTASVLRWLAWKGASRSRRFSSGSRLGNRL